MKGKLFKILTSIIVCFALLFSVACSSENVNNDVKDETNLKIMVLNRGYGVEWLNKLKDAFEKQNSGIHVEVKEVVLNTAITTALEGGKAKNDYDLFFVVDNAQSASLVDANSTRDGGFLDLTSLYNTMIPGETKTFGQKMNASLKAQYSIDGRYYTFPWAISSMGLFYNETVLNNALGSGNWEVPNTTDELFALGDSFKVNNNNKFLLYSSVLESVSQSLFTSWWAQYEGLENYNRFWNGIYYNALEGEEEGNSYKIFSQQGRLKAMQVAERLCRANNGYSIKNAGEITDLTYTKYQTKFFTSSEKYALYPTGDWLYNESGSNSDSVVKMMKTPIISSIVEKLEYRDGGNYMSDAMLSAVITAIDNGETSYAGVSANDFNKLKEARTVCSSNANLQLGFIPSYANAAELAVKFLLFMASDEGIKTYKSSIVGGFAPFDYLYDTSEFTDYESSVYNVVNDANFVQVSLMNKLFYKGGVSSISIPAISMDTAFNVASGSGVYKTAQEYYDYFINEYNATSWNTVLKKI